MKPSQPSAFVRAVALACMVSLGAGPLMAQASPAPAATPAPAPSPAASGDPTANSIPPAKFNLAPPVDNPKFDLASPILLGASVAVTVAGTILCFYSGTMKPAYDSAYSAWSASPTSANLAARDSAAGAFLAPLIVGIGLDVAGLVLSITGFGAGNGALNLKNVPPPAASPAP